MYDRLSFIFDNHEIICLLPLTKCTLKKIVGRCGKNSNLTRFTCTCFTFCVLIVLKIVLGNYYGSEAVLENHRSTENGSNIVKRFRNVVILIIKNAGVVIQS